MGSKKRSKTAKGVPVLPFDLTALSSKAVHRSAKLKKKKKSSLDHYGVLTFCKEYGFGQMIAQQLQRGLQAEGRHVHELVDQLRTLGDVQSREMLQAMGVTPLNAATIVTKLDLTPADKSNNFSRYVFIGSLYLLFYLSCVSLLYRAVS